MTHIHGNGKEKRPPGQDPGRPLRRLNAWKTRYLEHPRAGTGWESNAKRTHGRVLAAALFALLGMSMGRMIHSV